MDRESSIVRLHSAIVWRDLGFRVEGLTLNLTLPGDTGIPSNCRRL